MKIYFDTEYQGRDLVSLGAVTDYGDQFYAETGLPLEDEWLLANVAPYLRGEVRTVESIRDDFIQFCGPSPEFWAWYGAHDWVIVCELFGGLIHLPRHWPKVYHEARLAVSHDDLPRNDMPHNALSDALWLRSVFRGGELI